MNNSQETKFVPEKPAAKKISFFSAMLIVLGSSIGAGIFFKSGSVLSNSQSSLVLAVFSWIIASFAVIAMGLSLIEIASVRNDNLSLISWTKIFNGKVIYNATKNFMVYVYLPLTYFFMPLYVILSLQDGIGSLIGQDAATFGTNVDWLIWTVISLVMSVYFLTIPALWSHVGNIQNKIITYVKFIPLVLVTILGYVLKGTGASDYAISATVQLDTAATIETGSTFSQIYGAGAGLGLFLAIAAIFFAYDGFYVAAGISSEMKEPKRTPLALFLGLGITTIIYLVIAISMSINGGSFYGMKDAMVTLFGGANNASAAKAAAIVFGVINLAIAIGVMGIINGFSMWAPRYVEDLIAQGELPYWEKYFKKLNPNFPIVGVIYSLVITIPTVIVFTLIGALAYTPSDDYSIYSLDAALSMSRLYHFADSMANWTALFTFAFIGCAVFGALKNKSSNKITINQSVPFFKFWAWAAVSLISISLLITVLVPFVDLILLAAFNQQAYATKLMNANSALTLESAKEQTHTFLTDQIVSRVMLVVVLILFIVLAFVPGIIQDLINKKKHGSIEKFEEYRESILATA
ncbi:APC family permease [Mycoplasmopsis meleagridis]|uniref:APC family permease n=1 Tax=Mycoplasmopsis meleagridis TaxID=29561 RepID=UPI00073D71EB|nr:APC family permease [Mycoplasmopsis meleagridis]KUH47343.1 hypothetical protein ASB56_01900 [Mycoplasmopsis meleagridis]